MKTNTVFHFIFLSVFVLIMPQMGVAQQTSEVEQAAADARRDAELNVSPLAWGSAGIVCSFFAPIYAYLALPEVPVGALLGKSPVYVEAYTQVYQQDARRRRIQSSVIGCAIASAASSVGYYLFVLPEENGSQ